MGERGQNKCARINDDDESEIRGMICRMLISEGYDGIKTDDGRDGI